MIVVLRIHNNWICCAAEWQNFREGGSNDRRAMSCPLGTGMLFVAEFCGDGGPCKVVPSQRFSYEVW